MFWGCVCRVKGHRAVLGLASVQKVQIFRSLDVASLVAFRLMRISRMSAFEYLSIFIDRVTIFKHPLTITYLQLSLASLFPSCFLIYHHKQPPPLFSSSSRLYLLVNIVFFTHLLFFFFLCSLALVETRVLPFRLSKWLFQCAYVFYLFICC